MAALPFVGKRLGEVDEPEVALGICTRCGGLGRVAHYGYPLAGVAANRRYDYLPAYSGGYQITEYPCPECQPGAVEFVPASSDPRDGATATYMNRQYDLLMERDETFEKAVARAREEMMERFRRETYRQMKGG